ncbi:hypothetical protein GCM10027298_23390 [Epidermidibacterium keratini]
MNELAVGQRVMVKVRIEGSGGALCTFTDGTQRGSGSCIVSAVERDAQTDQRIRLLTVTA